MDELAFEKVAYEKLNALELALEDVDPDIIEVSSSDGVLKLACSSGPTIVINSHRAARQIWMAAVSSAWHFDFKDDKWVDSKTAEELAPVLSALVAEHASLEISFDN